MDPEIPHNNDSSLNHARPGVGADGGVNVTPNTLVPYQPTCPMSLVLEDTEDSYVLLSLTVLLTTSSSIITQQGQCHVILKGNLFPQPVASSASVTATSKQQDVFIVHSNSLPSPFTIPAESSSNSTAESPGALTSAEMVPRKLHGGCLVIDLTDANPYVHLMAITEHGRPQCY
jgi:hypothetical protein